MLPLILAGITTAAALGSAVSQAGQQRKAKREYLEDQRRQARLTALRHGRWTQANTHQEWDDLYPGWVVDARMRKKGAQDAADANFAFNPQSLVPFVQAGTQLASGIYDQANKPGGEDYKPTGSMVLNQPSALSASSALSYYDDSKPYYQNFDPNDLVYRGSVGVPGDKEYGTGTWDYDMGRTKRWWED